MTKMEIDGNMYKLENARTCMENVFGERGLFQISHLFPPFPGQLDYCCRPFDLASVSQLGVWLLSLDGMVVYRTLLPYPVPLPPAFYQIGLKFGWWPGNHFILLAEERQRL